MTGREDGQKPLEGIDFNQARVEMIIDRAGEAGWTTGGITGYDHFAFVRQDGRYSISPQEAAVRLGLLGSDDDYWKLLPAGYLVKYEGNDLAVAHTGDFSEIADGTMTPFVDRVIELGQELNRHQESEILHFEDKYTIARRQKTHGGGGLISTAELFAKDLLPVKATNTMIDRISSSEGENVIRMMISAGWPRHEAIARMVSLLAPVAVANQNPEASAEMLGRWHEHADHRQTKLVEAIQRYHSGEQSLEVALANHKIFDTVTGVAEGVRRTLNRSRGELAWESDRVASSG